MSLLVQVMATGSDLVTSSSSGFYHSIFQSSNSRGPSDNRSSGEDVDTVGRVNRRLELTLKV